MLSHGSVGWQWRVGAICVSLEHSDKVRGSTSRDESTGLAREPLHCSCRDGLGSLFACCFLPCS